MNDNTANILHVLGSMRPAAIRLSPTPTEQAWEAFSWRALGVGTLLGVALALMAGMSTFFPVRFDRSTKDVAVLISILSVLMVTLSFCAKMGSSVILGINNFRSRFDIRVRTMEHHFLQIRALDLFSVRDLKIARRYIETEAKLRRDTVTSIVGGRELVAVFVVIGAAYNINKEIGSMLAAWVFEVLNRPLQLSDFVLLGGVEILFLLLVQALWSNRKVRRHEFELEVLDMHLMQREPST